MQLENKGPPLLQLSALLAEIRRAPGNGELHWKSHRLLKDFATQSHSILATHQPLIYDLLLIFVPW